MIDIETYIYSLKIKWIKNLLEDELPKWKLIPKYYIDKFGDNFLIFYCNIENIKHLNLTGLPEFYKDLIKIWIKSKQMTEVKEPLTFYWIRNQIIWWNKNIKVNNKLLFFRNWIKSNIIFINDILNDDGKIDENIILSKLDNKTNYIAEIHMILLAISREWKIKLAGDDSSKSKVKTKLVAHLKRKSLFLYDTKSIYSILIDGKVEKPYTQTYWERTLRTKINWHDLYSLNKQLPDNRFKQFRFRILNRIFTSREIRHSWKMVEHPLCLKCNEPETYEHVFLTCQAVDIYWNKIQDLFGVCGIQRNIRNMKTVVIGYKISDKEYFFINLTIVIVVFSIYKAYFKSENWTKEYDIYRLFKSELEFICMYYKYKKIYNSFLDTMLKHV